VRYRCENEQRSADGIEYCSIGDPNAPTTIMLVGDSHARHWTAALSDVVGRSKRSPQLNDALLIPLPHPSGASRWLNDPANRARLDAALRLLGRHPIDR
jgi:hypothetical protein